MAGLAAAAEAEALLDDVAAPPALDVHEVLDHSARSVKRARRYVSQVQASHYTS
jgi:hypothetical protein